MILRNEGISADHRHSQVIGHMYQRRTKQVYWLIDLSRNKIGMVGEDGAHVYNCEFSYRKCECR